MLGALCLFLAAACGYDYSRNKIPNYIILLIGISGMLEKAKAGWEEVGFYLLVAGLVMALLYPIYKIGGIGAGDVKLLGVTAGYLPFKKILVFLFVSLFVASVISLIKMWKRELFGARMRYFLSYLADVMRKGAWKLYLENQEENREVGICLSGPILISVLLHLGGVY